MTNTVKLGKHQQKMYNFIKGVNGWHTYSWDSMTVNIVESLVARGLVKTNEFHQFSKV